MYKIRKTAKKFLCLFMCTVFVLTISSFGGGAPVASAEETLNDLKDQYEELDQKIAANEQKLNEIQSDIATNEQRLSNLNGQIDAIKEQIGLLNDRIGVLTGDIDTLQGQIDTLNGEIKSLNTKIETTKQQIVDTRLEMSETQKQVLERIRASYMAGEASSLEILFSSSDLSSFLTRKELIERVTENDRDLIEALEQKTAALAELESGLSSQKTDLENKKNQLDVQMGTLVNRQEDLVTSKQEEQNKKQDVTNKYAQVNEIISELDKDSEAYKQQLARQRQEREQLEAEIDAYIKEHGSSEGDVPDASYENDGEMCWPVPYSNTALTATYPAYSDGSPHWGIDIVVRDSNGANISNGKNIVAAQGGEVILALNDGNWNSGFGNYMIIDHGDGKMTLYAHCKTLVVSKGDVVKKGQKIAQIGLTGNTTGYHLHFEVRIKKSDGSISRVNPLNYVSKP